MRRNGGAGASWVCAGIGLAMAAMAATALGGCAVPRAEEAVSSSAALDESSPDEASPSGPDCEGRAGFGVAATTVTPSGECRIERCAEGRANQETDWSGGFGRALSSEEQLADGCENDLAQPPFTADMGSIRGDLKRDADWERADLLGYGGGEFVVHVREDDANIIKSDLGVIVQLTSDEGVAYDLSVTGPGSCTAADGGDGIVGIDPNNGRRGEIGKYAVLAWPDRTAIDDGGDVVIRVTYRGGSTVHGDGKFRLFVFPARESDRAQPTSLVCTR